MTHLDDVSAAFSDAQAAGQEVLALERADDERHPLPLFDALGRAEAAYQQASELCRSLREEIEREIT
jgi:hypothetical protein